MTFDLTALINWSVLLSALSLIGSFFVLEAIKNVVADRVGRIMARRRFVARPDFAVGRNSGTRVAWVLPCGETVRGRIVRVDNIFITVRMDNGDSKKVPLLGWSEKEWIVVTAAERAP